MKRQPTYQWRLREVMAEHGMYKTTDLAAPLGERGIDLSPSQVHRLVSQRPERLSLTVLAALCDIFSCEPSQLITVDAHDVTQRRRRAASGNVVDLAATGRPKRARVYRDDR